MRLCSVSITTGNDGKEQYAVVPMGVKTPVALCGKDKQAASLFADAPAMLDMLELLAKEFSNLNPKFPMGAGKQAELASLAERAQRVVAKHRPG